MDMDLLFALPATYWPGAVFDGIFVSIFKLWHSGGKQEQKAMEHGEEDCFNTLS